MTEQEIAALGPAFAAYLRRFRGCLGQDRTAGHFGTYCRGVLASRKSVTTRSTDGNVENWSRSPGPPGRRSGPSRSSW